MESKTSKTTNNQGFTLIELLIAMAIASVVAGAFYMASRAQQESFEVQDQVMTMQQNLRAGMFYMANEMRMAGYDDPDNILNTGITTATNISLAFTVGVGVGGTAPIYTYSYTAADRILRRNEGGGAQPVADNIEALGFAYAYDEDDDGDIDTYNDSGRDLIIWGIGPNAAGNWANLDTDKNGIIDEDDFGSDENLIVETNMGLIETNMDSDTDTGTPWNIADIRAVRIWLLARADRGDNKYANDTEYVIGNQKFTFVDDSRGIETRNIRRRLLTTTVNFRNLAQ
ncbi:MAG: prepilin-type N-terminal cleavage/methylation domain-containing protein [Proteobacteria bacterium]|nr:prepilin-type N-terminal cleavage/methylation domain-containing protein [Pseudomonadota bacterium]